MAKHTQTLVLVTELDIYFNQSLFGICKNGSHGNIPEGVSGLVSRVAECHEIWYQSRDIVKQLCAACLFLFGGWVCCKALLNVELNCFCSLH